MELVSVIIPTYNGYDYLKRAIDSVFNQSYPYIELIVVDDNGKNTDGNRKTSEIIDSYGSKDIMYIVHEKNMNGAVARNTGINAAKGHYICFLDDDDVMLPNRIEKSVCILNNSGYDGIFCDVLCADEKLLPQKIIKIAKEGNCSKEILMNEMFFGTGSNLFLTKRSCKSLNGFNPTYVRNQDIEFMLRFYRSYKTKKINEILLIKSKNQSNNIPNYSKYVKVKEQFNRDFEKEILSLSESDRSMYFKNLKNKLEIIDIKQKSLFEIIKCFKLKKVFKCIILKYCSNDSILFVIANNLRKKYIFYKLKSSIPKDVVLFIERYRTDGN